MKNEREIAKKITAYLDHGVAELKPGVAYRLQQGRAEALARLGERVPATARAQAYAGAGGKTSASRPFYAQVRFWLGIAILAAAAFGYQQWQLYQQINESEELDAQILSSDLPLDAYLDRGFQNWLKTTSFDR